MLVNISERMNEVRFSLDSAKAEAAILFISSTYKDVDQHSVWKIIYFADQSHLIQYGRPVIGDIFHALPYGPVPTNLYEDFKHARGYSNLENNVFKNTTIKENIINNNLEPDMEEFSDSDIECLKQSIELVKKMDFQERKDKSHDAAWFQAFNYTSNKAMDFLLIAKSGGATEEDIKQIMNCSENERLQIFS